LKKFDGVFFLGVWREYGLCLSAFEYVGVSISDSDIYIQAERQLTVIRERMEINYC